MVVSTAALVQAALAYPKRPTSCRWRAVEKPLPYPRAPAGARAGRSGRPDPAGTRLQRRRTHRRHQGAKIFPDEACRCRGCSRMPRLPMVGIRGRLTADPFVAPDPLDRRELPDAIWVSYIGMSMNTKMHTTAAQVSRAGGPPSGGAATTIEIGRSGVVRERRGRRAGPSRRCRRGLHRPAPVSSSPAGRPDGRRDGVLIFQVRYMDAFQRPAGDRDARRDAGWDAGKDLGARKRAPQPPAVRGIPPCGDGKIFDNV